MDHLPQPSQPGCRDVHVEYYCVAEDICSNEQDFERFPLQRGWNMNKLSKLDCSDGQTVESLLSILQGWLYFGLLHAVVNVPFDQSSFITDTRFAQRRISTIDFPALMARWYTANRPSDHASWTPPQRLDKYRQMIREAERLRDVFETANTMLISISYAAIKSADLVPQSLLLSIDILLSSLSYTAVIIYGLENTASVGGAAHINFHSLGMFQDWCPHAFRRLRAVVNNSALYFIGRCAIPQDHALHEGCSTSQRCNSERVSIDSYKQAHCCTDLALCESQGQELQTRCCEILDNDDYPVLLSEECASGQINLDVVAAQVSPPYVAISHVWVHGLGNPQENSMPRCQLQRLHSQLHGCLAREPLPFWIDTILCPIDGLYCEKAIAKMVPTYRNAHCVLVLDRSIQQVPHDRAAVELLAHIVSSMWMQRLWTLQEGALNQRVVIQFADGQHDLDELLKAVGDDTSMLATCHETVSRDLLSACQTARLVGVPFSPGVNLDFSLWINVLQFRQTSEPPDESLCLAALLGHDLRVIAPLTPDERFIKIYEAQRIFPTNIIFLTHCKMLQDGMRWAPQSYLNHGSGHGGSLLSAPAYMKAVFLAPLGLVLDAYCYRFVASDRITVPMIFCEERTGICFIVASATSEERAEYRPSSLQHWSGEFGIVFETRQDNNSGRSAMAVLTTLAEEIEPTPDMARVLETLETPDKSFRRMHSIQQVIVGLEPRFGQIAELANVSLVIESIIAKQRICIA